MTTTSQAQTCRTREAAMLERCRVAFPKTFPRGFTGWKPMAAGIRDKIAAALELSEPHDLAALKAVLAAHARCLPYLRAVARGGPRKELDWTNAGKVTPAEQAQAAQRLKERLAELRRTQRARSRAAQARRRPMAPTGKPAPAVTMRKRRSPQKPTGGARG